MSHTPKTKEEILEELKLDFNAYKEYDGRSGVDVMVIPIDHVNKIIDSRVSSALDLHARGERERKREELAELEHDQWIAWSKDIAETEQITPARLERWKTLWRPYSELTEAEKDQDREWADKVIELLSDPK